MMTVLKKTILSLICLLLAMSCQKQPSVIRSAFYFWQTHLDSMNFESTFVQQQAVERLYICLLNIEATPQNQAKPSIATAVDWSIIPTEIDIVPVVYIPNRVFEQMDTLEITQFAQNLSNYLWRKIPPSVSERFVEVQIDCDWSERTGTAYFSFLTKFKKQIKQPLSATIRLHQIKYRSKTGIPPVDRGALMMYNLNAPNKYSEQNSIFNAVECRKYLNGQKRYELPLDVALPLFSWGLVFRNKGYKGILNGLNTRESKNLSFLDAYTDGTSRHNLEGSKKYFHVTQDTVFRDLYLRYGDEIEIEEVTENDLLDAADLARPMLNSDTTNLIFYHLNTSILKNYNANVFQKIANRLR